MPEGPRACASSSKGRISPRLSDVITSRIPRTRRLDKVLKSAARLQELIPDPVLVRGTAAALHAGHRESYDHDHVLVDLDQRYEQVLDAVEASEGWATSVRASRPPMTILGSLDGVPAGLRNLRRVRPLETIRVEVAPNTFVTAPTAAEALRVKAYLVVQRNQVRDYLDVAALSRHLGRAESCAVLREIDDFYDDRSQTQGSVLTSLILVLASPSPRDADVIAELPRYRGLDPAWHDWSDVIAVCQDLALGLSEE